VELVPKEGSEPEPELTAIVREAARNSGRWLHTDVLAQRNPAQLAYKAQGDLVVMGSGLADELGLPLDDGPTGDRCIVVVQGGLERSQPPASASYSSAGVASHH
jgi:hypothetical protein